MFLARSATLFLAGLLLAWSPAQLLATDLEAKATVPLARISGEGMVKAIPDIALVNFTILTEAPKAQAAAAENARKADAFLEAVKKFLKADDTVKTTGYQIVPLQQYGERGKKPAITGYRARNSFEVKIKDPTRLGDLIDLGTQHGVNEIHGPFWQHSRQDALIQEASVKALQQAKLMAEALAQSQNLKVKRLLRVSTQGRMAPFPRAEASLMRAPAGVETPATPIEVGEQEIRAHVEAVFELE